MEAFFANDSLICGRFTHQGGCPLSSLGAEGGPLFFWRGNTATGEGSGLVLRWEKNGIDHGNCWEAAVMRVGLAQIRPVLGRVEDNLELHRDMIRRAEAERVDLLVFPELSLTGYSLRD